ncbi:MAG: HAD-IA family hydrolase [Microcoleaceae cyanobacterium]
MLKALIFDVDGTLADTEQQGHRVAFNRAFADEGLGWDWSVDFYGELLKVPGGKERMRHFITQYKPDFQIPGETGPAADSPGLDEFIKKLHKQKTNYYLEIIASGAIELRPGVERLMQAARDAGLRLAIATTTTKANATSLLEKKLDLGWFEVIAAGDIVPKKKPDPAIYTYTLEKMALNPSECLAFEDSHPGLLAALAADLTTIVTVNQYTQNQDFTGASLILDHLGEPDHGCQVLGGAATEKFTAKPGGNDYLTVEDVYQLFAD